VLGMQRLDLRVGGLGEVEDIIALQSLVEKGQAQREDDQSDEDELSAQDLDLKDTRVMNDFAIHDGQYGTDLFDFDIGRREIIPVQYREIRQLSRLH
jgi:hypothetical protein